MNEISLMSNAELAALCERKEKEFNEARTELAKWYERMYDCSNEYMAAKAVLDGRNGKAVKTDKP